MVSALPPLTTAILVVVLGSTLASVTWKMVPSSADTPPLALINTTNKQTASSTISNENKAYQQIPNWHLFGEVQKKTVARPVAIAEAPKEAPDTQLRLTLKGVVASGNARNAWAIIADRSGREDSYGIEASLPGGATLKEIYTDRIILLHNGRLETLRLPRMDVASATNKSFSRRTTSRNTRRNKNTVSSRALNGGKISRVSSAGSALLRNYREKLLSDPQSVMNSVRAEPYRQAGKLKGYRIFPGRDKSFFGQLGLEPGDVVTSVNNIALDSPLKGLEVMQSVTEATEVSVEILRNGVRQTFLVPMN